MRSVWKRIQGGVVKRVPVFHNLQPDLLSVGASSYRVFCLTEEPPRFKTRDLDDMPGHWLNAKLMGA